MLGVTNGNSNWEKARQRHSYINWVCRGEAWGDHNAVEQKLV